MRTPGGPMIKKIAYIGIAVRDINEAKKTFTQTLHSEVVRDGASEIDQVKNAFITIGRDQIARARAHRR